MAKNTQPDWISLKNGKEIFINGKDFRVAIVEDTKSRELTIHLYADALYIRPRPLTAFLKTGKEDFNGQVLKIRASGKPGSKRRKKEGVQIVYVD